VWAGTTTTGDSRQLVGRGACDQHDEHGGDRPAADHRQAEIAASPAELFAQFGFPHRITSRSAKVLEISRMPGKNAVGIARTLERLQQRFEH
jgi:hypothetical protein